MHINDVNRALKTRKQTKPVAATIAPQAAIYGAQQRIRDVRTQIFAALKIASRIQGSEPLRAQLRKMHELVTGMECDLKAITLPKI